MPGSVVVISPKFNAGAKFMHANRGNIVISKSTGLDHCDLMAAKRYKVSVRGIPCYSSESVAELAFFHKLYLARGGVKVFGWSKPMGLELSGKNILIVGFGDIGKAIARVARGFGMHVDTYDKVLHDTRKDLCRKIRRADFVDICVPSDHNTRCLFGKKRIQVNEGQETSSRECF